MDDIVNAFPDRTLPDGSKPEGVVIVASPEELDRLGRLDDTPILSEALLCPLAASAPVSGEILADANLLVIEVDPAIPESVQRVRAIRSERRGLLIVAALRGMDVSVVRTLVRQGIADVVELPFDRQALAAQVADTLARNSTPSLAPGLAPMLSVVGGVGGCGTTTVITHLAAHFAQTMKLRTCVADLDLQSGEVAYYVGRTPRITIETLLTAGERLDQEFVRGALLDSGHGFTLIAAPERVMPLDDVDVDSLLAMLKLLRQQFDLVIVDLPNDWTSWGLSVVSASSEVVLVTDLSVACLRQAKRRLDLFESVGVDAGGVKLVANRVERGLFKSVNLEAAAKALGGQFVGTIGDVGHSLIDAQDEGLLLFDTNRNAKFASQIADLAKALWNKTD
ncbi:hypothetical protein OZN62_07065 [Aurantiacibacter sp. MUD11]|uniref:AAA family ATPase n=1 Tax=Aurantiacibacter sp. MUD11 TaxID=3003265 RepID=UPI0022AB1195|nr:hypothetical protein [Aurantiacibacter sp. MUD11]WAT16708.1 hypothetical protein OZN62_07065 [Aurantiacibacter sp. MUD11]